MSALFQQAANDPDTLETAEWLDALETVIEREGPERAHFLLEALIDKARRSGTHLPYSANTAYINTIPPHLEEHSPGDASIEAAHSLLQPMECDGDRGACKPRRGGVRRTYRQLCVVEHADGSGIQPFLACDRRLILAAT